MSTLEVAIVVAIVVWLLINATDSIPMKPQGLNVIVRVAIILVGVLIILDAWRLS